MILHRASVYLSGIVCLSLLIHACQAEVIQDNRGVGTSELKQEPGKDEDAKAEVTNPTNTPVAEKTTAPSGGTTPAPAPGGASGGAASYTMSWDASLDPAVVSYKVFVVPPDQNPRFAGKTDVPIQMKNYAINALTKSGSKYTVTVTRDEVKAALGSAALNVSAYCFTVVAVNGVGNSAHSPLICP